MMTMIRQLERLRDEAADDEQIFAGKLSDAQRRRKHWERRIADETAYLPCPCTMIKQDETCPVGYPSLLCEDCDGKGHLPATPSYAAVFKDRPGLDELVRGANIEERA